MYNLSLLSYREKFGRLYFWSESLESVDNKSFKFDRSKPHDVVPDQAGPVNCIRESFLCKSMNYFDTFKVLLCLDMAKLPWEIIRKTNHRWRSPPLTKRVFEALWVLWGKIGWGNLPFFFSLHFYPPLLQPCWWPDFSQASTRLPIKRICLPTSWSLTKLKMSYIQEGKSVSYFHCVKQGILGVGMAHRFGPDWVDGRSTTWLERVHRGVLHGSP